MGPEVVGITLFRPENKGYRERDIGPEVAGMIWLRPVLSGFWA